MKNMNQRQGPLHHRLMKKNITKTLEPTTGSPSASPSASPTTGTPSTSPTKSPKVMCNHRRKYDDAIAFCNSTGTSLCNFEQLETRVNNTGGFTCNEYWVFDELLGASYKNCKRQQRVVRMNKAKRFACRSRHKKKKIYLLLIKNCIYKLFISYIIITTIFIFGYYNNNDDANIYTTTINRFST